MLKRMTIHFKNKSIQLVDLKPEKVAEIEKNLADASTLYKFEHDGEVYAIDTSKVVYYHIRNIDV